jgi:YidC/Oxa1 family membrane protein insertase
MGYLYTQFLYRPLLNLLFFLYNNVYADLGIAIILLTIIVRLVLLPLFYKSAKDQTILQKIAPRIQELQKIHKEDKERQVKEIMAVYKEHRVNPFSGFLFIIIQLPILIALYGVFLRGIKTLDGSLLYSFVHIPQNINYHFLGLIDLSSHSVVLVALAAITQYLQSYFLLKAAGRSGKKVGETSMAERMGRQMMYIGPLLSLVILWPLPSAVALYWLTTSAFSVIQQIVINKKIQTPQDL